MSEAVPVPSSDRMAWNVIPLPKLPGKWRILFHSMISWWLAAASLARTIGVPGPAAQSDHSGAIAIWLGDEDRSVGNGLVLPEPKVIRPLLPTNSWLLPVNCWP